MPNTSDKGYFSVTLDSYMTDLQTCLRVVHKANQLGVDGYKLTEVTTTKTPVTDRTLVHFHCVRKETGWRYKVWFFKELTKYLWRKLWAGKDNAKSYVENYSKESGKTD